MDQTLAAKRSEKDADTRERLLAAALRIFANRGIASATLREITEEAGANVAAVNYYFRSKEELTRTVLETCMRPINDARLKALQSCVDANEGRTPPLESIIEALVRPMVELSVDPNGGRPPVRLLLQVRALPHPLTNTILAEQFDLIHRHFIDKLSAALPDLPAEEVGLRYDFARGAIMQILGDLDPAARDLPDLKLKQVKNDNERIIRHLVDFISAGFRAPSKT
ncbi:TetR/AcrR family transcriptional regulator [Nitratireductor indicus]|uniref:TetR family transcription factor n=1 Tax=Nitratireductor indicus C115 TaxID=1231190 RepID=K2PK83_9HYPH|nr:TetR family transcriptional regulator [Nitratireductor indicus]EKF41537.1 TetR family transcription factor [Nitratireductor indicus C115]MDS1136065.1 TetR/AcrR family transcriptional regulator [Nitratireductor indicus]SFQ69847.1 transcriptional regulator, TetR family [Nitratireductor indicus]